MKRFLRRISLGLMATVLCGPAMAQPQTTQVAAVPSITIGNDAPAARGATVGSDTYIYWGTGFFIDRSGHVLTAYHLVDDCRGIDVVANGRRERTSVVASDAANDLTVLRVSSTFGEPAAFDRPAHVSGGAMVTILGYKPLGEALRARAPAQSAVFNSMVLDEDVPNHIALVSDAQPGASGSPVITRDGLVVGMLQSKLVRSGTLSSAGQPGEIRLAIKADIAENFLRAHGIEPIEGDAGRHARMNVIGELASAEVKIECHR